MLRREFLGAVASASLNWAQGPRRPNILFVIADDLNTDLGCYGHALVQSPHIDSLARRGVRFERAYAQYPVCNPSRSSFLSGRYPETTGVLDNRANPRANLKGVLFLPEYLRSQGYFTASIGKIYHDGMQGPNDWDVLLDPRPSSKIGRTGEGRNLTDGKFPFFEVRAAEGGDDDHADGLIAKEAVRLLEEKRDKPWFLAVGFRKPHDPYIAPKKYFEAYPLSKIPSPKARRTMAMTSRPPRIPARGTRLMSRVFGSSARLTRLASVIRTRNWARCLPPSLVRPTRPTRSSFSLAITDFIRANIIGSTR